MFFLLNFIITITNTATIVKVINTDPVIIQRSCLFVLFDKLSGTSGSTTIDLNSIFISTLSVMFCFIFAYIHT